MSKKKCKLSLGEAIDRRDAIIASSVALMGLYAQGCRTSALGGLNSNIQDSKAQIADANAIKFKAGLNYTKSCAEIRGKGHKTLSTKFVEAIGKDAEGNKGVLYDQSKLHDIVIIGSGYGASCLAARLSEAATSNPSIVVLERGKEWLPGSFPSTLSEVTSASSTTVNPLGLFNYHLDLASSLDFVSASGLGGTSLINAGIAIEPHEKVFDQQEWDGYFQNPKERKKYYDRARNALGISKSPYAKPNDEATGNEETNKVKYLRNTAKTWTQKRKDGFTFSKLDITLASAEEKGTPSTFKFEGCIGCGDCFSGCNVGAKKSVNMTYLATAVKNKTKVITEAQVKLIAKVKGPLLSDQEYYRVKVMNPKTQTFGSNQIAAKMVIVAAGTLGTFQILHDSKYPKVDSQKDARDELRQPLTYSTQLGQHFSGNGDVVGFGVNIEDKNITSDGRVNSGGPGLGLLTDTTRVGPVVESLLDLRKGSDLTQHMAVVDACIPSPMAKPLTGAINNADELVEKLFRKPSRIGNYSLDHGFVFLVLNHDGSDGQMVSGSNGYAKVKWSNNYSQRDFVKKSNNLMESIVKDWGGSFIPNARPSSVHPLGGVRMAATDKKGASNLSGQIFTGNDDKVHDGLYVAGGSVLPTSTGIHPFLTITAIAEKMASGIINENKLGLFTPSQST